VRDHKICNHMLKVCFGLATADDPQESNVRKLRLLRHPHG
jgi:hypothetical protein